MGTVVAVLHKGGEDSTETALAMLNTFKAKTAETYGIASPSFAAIEQSIEKLHCRKRFSQIAVGYIFRRILKRDKPQPLRFENTGLVFDGRIFPVRDQESDAEAFAHRLSANREKSAKNFIRETEGDFAFVICETEQIIAGRDAMGVRPLYYGENALFAGLASELKALWEIGIKDAISFPPGHIATVNKQGFKFMLARQLTPSKPKRVTMKAASQKLQLLLEKAVGERVADFREVAVAFSGGLDSSIISFLARRSGVHVQLVHVSLKDQPETEHAKQIAEDLRMPVHSYTYTENDVMKILPVVLHLTEESDPIKAGVGIPIYWAAERSAELGLKVMLAGQGADELFAGYKRYVDIYSQKGSKKAQAMIFRDAAQMYKNNCERDAKICNFLGIEIRMPFTAHEIVKFAVDLPISLKIQCGADTTRKLILRETARNLGLPETTVNRPKKAIQYATGVNRVLERTARQERISLREYIQRNFETAFQRRDSS